MVKNFDMDIKIRPKDEKDLHELLICCNAIDKFVNNYPYKEGKNDGVYYTFASDDLEVYVYRTQTLIVAQTQNKLC